MTISVIVSTYNQPLFLEKVLWGYTAQNWREFELVIADDGSGPETAALIERFRARTSLRITHVWHEDVGFRKTVILNRAILAAHGDYLVFTDGDCVPRADLIDVHRRLARPGRYLSGGYLKLPEKVSRAVDLDDVLSGRVARLGWLLSRGWWPGRKALRLVPPRRIARLLDRLTPTPATFNGNNSSAARSDLLAVNGFEGEMGYGGEDRALGYRLENLGVRGEQIRHRAICLHLHHDRPYRDPAVVQANRAVMERIRASGEVRSRQGIAELPDDPSLRVSGGTAGREFSRVPTTSARPADRRRPRGAHGERNQTWP